MRNAMIVTFLTCVMALAVSAQVSDKQIVAAAYPPDLAASADPTAPQRFATFVVADLNRDGQPLLVALYTNGSRAAICVLDRAGNVLARPSIRSLKGSTGAVETVDLDQDGVPEMVARFYSGHGPDIPDTWVFAWRNQRLVLISPFVQVGELQITVLSQIATADLDGDGHLELLAFSGVHRDDSGQIIPNDNTLVYAIGNGVLKQLARQVGFVAGFYRHTGRPATTIKSFSSGAGTTTLTVTDHPGSPVVTSGHVLLNGKEVFGPSDFKKRVHAMAAPVELVQGSNEISVQLEGKADAGIWVVIDAVGTKVNAASAKN